VGPLLYSKLPAVQVALPWLITWIPSSRYLPAVPESSHSAPARMRAVPAAPMSTPPVQLNCWMTVMVAPGRSRVPPLARSTRTADTFCLKTAVPLAVTLTARGETGTSKTALGEAP